MILLEWKEELGVQNYPTHHCAALSRLFQRSWSCVSLLRGQECCDFVTYLRHKRSNSSPNSLSPSSPNQLKALCCFQHESTGRVSEHPKPPLGLHHPLLLLLSNVILTRLRCDLLRTFSLTFSFLDIQLFTLSRTSSLWGGPPVPQHAPPK
jgi:hypothetical protein